MKTKVDRLEKDMERAHEKFVAIDVFNATVKPLEAELTEIKNDIKVILGFVQNKKPRR